MIDFEVLAKSLNYDSVEDMLRDLYTIKGLGLDKIGEILGVHRHTIKRKLASMNITIRKRGGGGTIGPNKLLEGIPLSRLGRAKIRQLATQLDLSPSTIYVYLAKKGAPRRGPQMNPHRTRIDAGKEIGKPVDLTGMESADPESPDPDNTDTMVDDPDTNEEEE